jgi:arginine decarboxylase
MKWKLEDSKLVYGVGSKDLDYLDINTEGKLELVLENQRISFEKIIKAFEEKTKYCDASFAIRIPQLISTQIKKLIASFAEAREKYNYQSKYYPIYPIKVNHSKFIIETIIKTHPTYGFESGTKSEFILLLQTLKNEKPRLIMCNGAKDREYLQSIKEAIADGFKVCISIESEQEMIDTLDILPLENYQLAFRIKPYVTLHGHWGASSGRHSKFGLAIGELHNVIRVLREKKATHLPTMLHSHPGSQITDLDGFERFATFVAKVYELLHKEGFTNLKTINFGGGLPIDYDNRLDEDFMQKYAEIFVKVLSKKLPKLQPIIMTESGRAITALSTIVIVKTIDRYSAFAETFYDKIIGVARWGEKTAEYKKVSSAGDVLKKWSKWDRRKPPLDDLYELNDYEFMSLELKKELRKLFFGFDDFEKHLDKIEAKLLLKPEFAVQGNFSVFNSIGDLVLVKQYFPVIPIRSLNQQPETIVRLFDITCDSDGEVAIYHPPVSEKKLFTEDDFQLTFTKPFSLGGFPVGDLKELKDSYLVIPLAGAYQDIVEFDHNLLGDLPDVLVALDGDWLIELLNGAQSISSILADVGFDCDVDDDPYYDNGVK